MTLPDGRIVAAARVYSNSGPYTGLSWLDPITETLTPFLAFPSSSGNDTGYPGMYWYNNQLWVSYYYGSLHATTDGICVAQVSIPLLNRSYWAATAGGNWSTPGNWTNGVPVGAGLKRCLMPPPAPR